MSPYNLDKLLAPTSIAIVAAAGEPVADALLRNIKGGGFTGRVGPVVSDVLLSGNYTFRFDQLEFVPDLVVVVSIASQMRDAIEAAARAGVSTMIFFTVRSDTDGCPITEELRTIARQHRMRVLGPDGLGLLMPYAKLSISLATALPRAGDLAMISQSGAIAAGMVGWSRLRDVGFSGIVCVGDELDVDVADLLDHFALDPRTKAILLYVEEISDARKFMSAARAASRLKPVIAIKAGRRMDQVRRADTHAGLLADADAVYEAAFARAGILRVADLRELFDCAETLGRLGSPTGRRLAILTNGGGLAALAVDRLMELGGVLAEISEETSSALARFAGRNPAAQNLVDIGDHAGAEKYAAALEILIDDPNNDAILVLNVDTALVPADEVAKTVGRILVERRKSGYGSTKPVLAVWIGASPSVRARLSGAKVPNYPTGSDAVRGFMHLVQHRALVEKLAQVPPAIFKDFEPKIETAKTIIAMARKERRDWLDPIEVRCLLEAYEIPMVPTFAASDEQEAAHYAAPIIERGGTVVLKIHSRDIIHKSEVGGVLLNIASIDSVKAAVSILLGRARACRPDAVVSGVIIQEMIVRQKSRELILGIVQDQTFGPVIVFGRGGTAVEVIDDKAVALPPLDLPLARDLIGRTRVARLMDAYRDVPEVAPNEVAKTLVKLSQMAADLPDIRELDINPILADERGVLALDGRVSIGPPQKVFAGSGPTNMAVRPYPSLWERWIEVGEHWRIFVRPIRPDDEPLIQDFLTKVSSEDRRLRFFAPMKHFSHEFMARLTQLDYSRAMAFVAFEESTNELLGVVRIHSDSVYESGEYAILLRSDLKGRGLGWGLMKLMIEYARGEGLRRVSGQVLQENTTMLAMCRRLGFQVTTDPDEPSICNVELNLVDSQ